MMKKPYNGYENIDLIHTYDHKFTGLSVYY